MSPASPSTGDFWITDVAELGLRYSPIFAWQSGGVPSTLPVGKLLNDAESIIYRRSQSQSLLYGVDRPVKAALFSDDQWCVIGALHEILHRGELLPIDPVVERVLAEELGHTIQHATFDSSSQSYQSKKASTGKSQQSLFHSAYSPFRVDVDVTPIAQFEDEQQGQSSCELEFLEQFNERWPRLSRYLHPQVKLANLLNNLEDQRRADWVLVHPKIYKSKASKGMVFEIHGKKKSELGSQALEEKSQRKKKHDLQKGYWTVYDIPRTEISDQSGKWVKELDDISALLENNASSRQDDCYTNALDGSCLLYTSPSPRD